MNKTCNYQLIKYRDAGMNTYTYFWTNEKKTISPYFDSEQEAHEWLKSEPACDVVRPKTRWVTDCE